jgi:hypothetical protein
MKRLIILIGLFVCAGAAFFGWRTGGVREDEVVDSGKGLRLGNGSAELGSSEVGIPGRGGEKVGPEVPLEGLGVRVKLQSGTLQLQSGGGVFDRVHIGEKEKIRLSVNLGRTVAGKPILISAPNGGTLKRVGGGSLEYVGNGKEESVELDFDPSLGRGAYTIRVQHGGESQIVDLWAGALPVLGEPGPKYVAGEFSEDVP